MKKLLKITVLLFLFIIGAALAIPYLFKDQIVKKVKEGINENLAAQVNFSDIDISLFRHFPRLSLGLDSVYVKGIQQFSKDTLISAKKVDVAVNLISAISGGTIQVYSVNLDQPRIHAIVDETGKANWEITKEDTAAKEEVAGEPFSMQLKSYSIENGYISYIDRESNMNMELVNFNHEGSGDFSSDLFTLKTASSADAVTFSYENIPYLLKTHAKIDAAIEVDAKNEKYSFKTDAIQLNDLKLSAGGFFQFLNDTTYNMDIAFNSPSNDFKSILSLVPAMYKNDFDKIKTSGSLLFNGNVKGKYSSVDMPSYNVNLDIKDGFFQYPQLPKPVKNINVTLKIQNPDGITDHTVIDIPTAHIEMDSQPFDFRLLVKNPVTAQYVDAAAKGQLDLSHLAEYIKLEEGTSISGLLKADINLKGNVTVITEKKAGPFSASGYLDVSNLAYSSKDLPQPIRNTNIKMEIQNPDGVPDHTIVNIPVAHVEIGNEPVDFRLLVKTPVSDLYFNGAAKGKFNLANVKEFMTLEPGTSVSGTLNADLSFSGRRSAIDKKDYQSIQTAGSVELFDLNYVSKDYPDGIVVEDLFANFNPRNVSFNDVKGRFMHSNFKAEGSIDNLLGYTFKDETLQGSMQFYADKVNLNEWMGEEDTTAVATEASAPFQVPANIAFTINANVDKVHYDKTDISDLSGRLNLRNETVDMQNVTGNALDGVITINGSYSTRVNKKNPDIAFTYDVKNINIQQAFYAFNSFQKLMPAGQFISGKLTSQMAVNGRLGESMMPDLTTLNGKGLFFVLEGVLKDFKPLTQIAQTLNVESLQNISMKDIKTNFEFANGKVLVKPFTVKVEDMEMEIGGVHGLDRSLDYIINLKVPRSRIGEKGNQYVNSLVTQAANKGVPVQVNEIVNYHLNLGGTIKQPQIKVNLKETGATLAQDIKKQATDFAKAKADTVKTAVKDTLTAIKKDLAKTAKEEISKRILGGADTAVASQPAADTKKRLESAGKGIINGFLKKKKAGADSTGSK
jgi:hypothetical protein